MAAIELLILITTVALLEAKWKLVIHEQDMEIVIPVQTPSPRHRGQARTL
jgi:hypothetical protein